MMQLNFKKQFEGKVKSGNKRCSIRPKGKRLRKAGEKVHLFTGLRTKECRKLGIAPCLKVTPIWMSCCTGHVVIDVEYQGDISSRYIRVYDRFEKFIPSKIKTHWITTKEKEKIIKADGFENEHEFDRFFLNQYELGAHPTFLTEFQIVEWGDIEVEI